MPSANYEVTVDLSAPSKVVTIDAVNDDVGNVQGVVPSGVAGRTDDTGLNLKGHLDSALGVGQTVRVYDGANYLGDATIAVGQTDWSFADPRTLINDQVLNYTAKVMDTAGNEGATSNLYNVTVDLSAPSTTAAVTTVTDNVDLSLIHI